MEELTLYYDVSIIAGTILNEGPGVMYSSAVYMIGRELYFERKRRLVPFGEYTPLGGFVKRIGIINRMIGKRRQVEEFTAEKNGRKFFDLNGLKFSVFLSAGRCFFPRGFRKL